jgi:hypothetical protein
MEQQPSNKLSIGAEAVAVLLAVSAGAGVGYALLLGTGSVVLALIMASPIALLLNNFFRGMLAKGKQ